jgi:hypothetical protein
MDHLTTGNSAKVYCLQQIETYIQQHQKSVSITCTYWGNVKLG